MTHWRQRNSVPAATPNSSRRSANSGATRQPSIREGEIAGGVLFVGIFFLVPILIVLCIRFACLTFVPELVQH